MAKGSTPKIATRDITMLSGWQQMFMEHVEENGGMFNAHAHLCRANTLGDEFLRHINTTPLDASKSSLPVKQNLVGDLHTGVAYTEESLRDRMRKEIERQIYFGVTRIDTNIDATPDLPEDGLLAIRVANELRKEYAHLIDIRIAPTPIFGFKTRKGKDERWRVYKRAAKLSQCSSLLPEKDDYTPGENPKGRIGFERHLRLGLELACELGHEFQVHVDQMNLADESGTERLLNALKFFDAPKVKGSNGGPTVWAIHVISPSAYDEYRFKKLVDDLLLYNVGVIVCPSAGLSMRCIRSHNSPTHNSLARVLDLAYMGVPIRLGTDNIQDVFVPPADGDMLTEVNIASNSVRLNSPSIWAKFACGISLNNVDLDSIGKVLEEDNKACRRYDPNWRSAAEM